MKQLGYIAINQHGEFLRLHDPDKHPRLQLMSRLSATHTSKMCCKTKDGKSKHFGYVVRGGWWQIYRVSEWVG